MANSKRQVALQVEQEVYEILKMKSERLGQSMAELLRDAVYEVAGLSGSPLEIARMMLELEQLKKETKEEEKSEEKSKPSTEAAKTALANPSTKTKTTTKK